MANDHPPTAEEIEALANRVTVLAWELTGVLRAAAMMGLNFRLDMVERDDPLNPGGPQYTEIQVERMEESEET